MINWKSIKKAADIPWPAFPVIHPETVRDPSSEARKIGFYPNKLTGPTKDSLGISKRSVSKRPFTAAWNPIARMGVNRWKRNDLGVYHTWQLAPGADPVPYAVSYQLSDGRFTTTMKKGYIKPLMYGLGNSKRAAYESDLANRYRWGRLFELAPDEATRANLRARMAAGQIPPIIMKGSYKPSPDERPVWLEDKWFGHPEEVVQATVDPGGERSVSHAMDRNIYVGGEDKDILNNQREEWMHQATLTPANRNSVVDGLLGGDDYVSARLKGENPLGAYELKPAEMTRMVALQKAAAARLGLPAFRSLDDWVAFARLQKYMAMKGITPLSPDSLDYPFAQGSYGKLGQSTSPDSILNLAVKLQNLRQQAKQQGNKDEYELRDRQLNQLWSALQDAIYMADNRGRNGDVMPA